MLHLKRVIRQRPGTELGDQGFTLIELLVVLLIIGILLAIAIPTFLSVTSTANDTAAQANLKTALTGADTYYQQNQQSYSYIMTPGDPGVSTITQIDTGLTYVTDEGIFDPSDTVNTTSPNVILIYWTGSNVTLENYSPGTQTCWTVWDIKAPVSSVGPGFPTQVGTWYSGAHIVGGCNPPGDLTVPDFQVWSQTSFPKFVS